MSKHFAPGRLGGAGPQDAASDRLAWRTASCPASVARAMLPALAIARNAVIGAALGAVFTGSLTMRRPVIFYAIRSFRGTDLDAHWERLPALRQDLRSMTAVFGGLRLPASTRSTAAAMTAGPASGIR